MKNAPIRCLVVDDEPQAIEILKSYISITPPLQLIGTTHHAPGAFDLLQKQAVDLLFMDIQMPQVTGIDFLRSLPQPPKTIFVSAHRDYAVEGFELSAVDYLLKPVSYDRFLKAVYKITLSGNSTSEAQVPIPSERFLYFRADRKMVKVLLHEILYAESLKDYVKIITNKGAIITKMSISSLEEMLPDDMFIRIHRSFIVSLRCIESFTPTDVWVGKQALPVGPLYRNELMGKVRIPGSM